MKGIFSGFENNAKLIKILMVFFLVIYQLTLFYSLSNEPVQLSDSEEYINAAKSFQNHKNFYSGNNHESLDYRMFSKRTPLYPLILSVFYSFHWHINFIYILQLFLGLLNILIGFFLINKLINTNRLVIFLFAIFVVFTPSQFIYSQLIMADLWLQSLVMLCVFSLVQFNANKKPQWLFGVAIFSVLAALLKPVFLMASFILAIWSFIQLVKIKSPVYYYILVLIPFLSWYSLAIHNKKTTGVFHYSSIGYINLLHYNTQIFLNRTIGKSETEKLLEPLMIKPHTKLEFANNYLEVNKVCSKAIFGNLHGYSYFHGKGMLYFFLDPGRFDIYHFFRVEDANAQGFLNANSTKNQWLRLYGSRPISSLLLILLFMVNLAKTIGFVGFIWLERRNRQVIFISLFVFYLAFLTGPLGASRFALPATLIIIVYASAFYTHLLKNRKFLNRNLLPREF
jgi:hypothetical protein